MKAKLIFFKNNISKLGFGVPLILLMLIAMVVLPLPPMLLDLLFTFNITISILILLAGIYALRPLDFAIFPTVLLLATLLRLALNVASTRVVLLNGHGGTEAAGKVIQSFGEVVIGGNYAVGLVVFIILIIINFVVVTKGAGRVSEVSARFTLDALPGRQMAIDADLNAGIIDQEKAKVAREEITKEADFYGAMDGASKFIRGDAIAGILILIINLIGGMGIGIFQHGLTFSNAAEFYALLTIGDGLVAQIPSLILSTAAAIMVTRVSSSQDIGKQLTFQLFSNPKTIYISGVVLFVLGIIPGMPHLSFAGIAFLLFGAAFVIKNKEKLLQKLAFLTGNTSIADHKFSDADIDTESDQEKSENLNEITWDDVPCVDNIGLEIGFGLIPFVDPNKSGELLKRIKGVRRKISKELGFLVPSVHIQDNLDLPSNGYRIKIKGVVVAQDTVHVDKDMAINPGNVINEIEGIKSKEPAFGLDAIWINKELKENALHLGYTVVDASTVVATHISQIISTFAYKLVGHLEVQKLLDMLAKDCEKLVEDLTPKTLPLSTIVKIVQTLLKENVPINDMKTIAEILTDVGQKSQDPAILVEEIRAALGSMIVQKINGYSDEVPVLTLDSSLEQILQKSIHTNIEQGMLIEPNLAEKLQYNIKQCANGMELKGLPLILLVSNGLRRALSKFIRAIVPGMSVMSYKEIPEDKQIKIIGVIGNS